MGETKENSRKVLHNILLSAPKPQLHLHLDGSITLAFMKRSVERMKASNPDRVSKLFLPENWSQISEAALLGWLMDIKQVQIQHGSIVDKNSNWKVFDFCNQFLQTKDDLYSATYDLVTSLHEKHSVDYVEIRFAPVLHTLHSLREAEAVEAVQSGFNSAKKDLAVKGKRIGGGIILCILRSYPISHAYETVNLASSVDGVLGIDVAGDEKTYPLSLFDAVLKLAKRSGVQVTVHAGEGNGQKNPKFLDNLKVAIDAGVERIGHGLALKSSSQDLIQKLNDQQVAVEVCLTSNCGNPEKCESLREHPLLFMLEKNVRVAALSCDNLLLSGSKLIGSPDPTNECVRALLDCFVTPQQLLSIIENGYAAGFHQDASEIGKMAVKKWIEIYLPKVSSTL